MEKSKARKDGKERMEKKGWRREEEEKVKNRQMLFFL
jgi:hypothetical protein